MAATERPNSPEPCVTAATTRTILENACCVSPVWQAQPTVKDIP